MSTFVDASSAAATGTPPDIATKAADDMVLVILGTRCDDGPTYVTPSGWALLEYLEINATLQAGVYAKTMASAGEAFPDFSPSAGTIDRLAVAACAYRPAAGTIIQVSASDVQSQEDSNVVCPALTAANVSRRVVLTAIAAQLTFAEVSGWAEHVEIESGGGGQFSRVTVGQQSIASSSPNPGSVTVVASDSTYNLGFQVALYDQPAGLDHFTVEKTSPVGTPKINTNIQLTITARTAGGTVYTDFVDTVDVSSANATISSGGGTTAAFTAGVLVHTIQVSSVEEGAVIDVEDTDTGLATGSSDPIPVWDLAATVEPGRVLLSFSSPVGDTSVRIHRSEFGPGFTPAVTEPNSIDDLIADLGWDLDGSATNPGKDELIAYRHLFDMTSGYGLLEGAGERYGYNDEAVGLVGNSAKVILGATLPPADSDTEIDDYFQATVAPLLDLQDGSGFTERQFRGFECSMRDLARVVKLVQNRGSFGGVQVIPASAFGKFGAFGGRFGEIHVTKEMLRTAGADANGDYLGITSYGGGLDQNAVGRGSYGWGLWLNGVDATTDPDRFYGPNLPTNMLTGVGHDHEEDWILFPDEKIIVCYRGGTGFGWPDQSAFIEAFEDLLAGIVSDASYGDEDPGASWTTASEAAAGFTAGTCAAFEAAYNGGSGVIIRNGRIVHQWGNNTPGDIASASKGLLCLLLLRKFADHTLIDTVAGGATTYEAYQVEPGVPASFVVEFYDSGGLMFASNEVTATPEAAQRARSAELVARNGWTDTLDRGGDQFVLIGLATEEGPDAASPWSPVGDGSDTLKVRLQDVTSADGRYLRCRIRKQVRGAGKTANLSVELRSPDGSTVLEDWGQTDIGTTNTLYEQDLEPLGNLSGEHQVWFIPSTS